MTLKFCGFFFGVGSSTTVARVPDLTLLASLSQDDEQISGLFFPFSAHLCSFTLSTIRTSAPSPWKRSFTAQEEAFILSNRLLLLLRGEKKKS